LIVTKNPENLTQEIMLEEDRKATENLIAASKPSKKLSFKCLRCENTTDDISKLRAMAYICDECLGKKSEIHHQRKIGHEQVGPHRGFSQSLRSHENERVDLGHEYSMQVRRA